MEERCPSTAMFGLEGGRNDFWTAKAAHCLSFARLAVHPGQLQIVRGILEMAAQFLAYLLGC